MSPWIQTFTGRQFWPLAPDPADIDIRDIAHALANTCRFSGHCSRFYSVAEHSIHVSNEVSRKHALWGLLHDASEAYLADLAAPLKAHFPDFVAAEKRLMEVVCMRFNLPFDEPEEVKIVDQRMLATEARDLMQADWSHLGKPYAWNNLTSSHWPLQEMVFLKTFEQLTGVTT